MTSDQILASTIVECKKTAGIWVALVKDADGLPYQLTLPSPSNADTTTLRKNIYTALLSVTKKTELVIPSSSKDSGIKGLAPQNPGGGTP